MGFKHGVEDPRSDRWLEWRRGLLLGGKCKLRWSWLQSVIIKTRIPYFLVHVAAGLFKVDGSANGSRYLMYCLTFFQNPLDSRRLSNKTQCNLGRRHDQSFIGDTAAIIRHEVTIIDVILSCTAEQFAVD